SAGALGCAADVVAPGVGGAPVSVVGRLGRESANLGSRSLSGTFTESLAGRLQPGTGSGRGAGSRTRTGLGEVFVEMTVAAGCSRIRAARAWIAVGRARTATLIDVDGTVVLQCIACFCQLILVVDVHGDHQRAATHGVRIGVGVRAMLFMRLLAEQRFEEVRDPGLVMRAIQRAVGGDKIGRASCREGVVVSGVAVFGR